MMHMGAARTVARIRMLGSRVARLSLDYPLPLHVGDRVLLRDPDAAGQAARILARLPQPFTAAEARQALRTTRRVVIPLLEWLDREGITRRLADDRRIMREPQGSRTSNGGR